MTLNYSYKGNCDPVQIHLLPGRYLFEAWGAAGGIENENFFGKGGYTSGIITLTKQTRFYAIIGSRGQRAVKAMTTPLGGCGGGGKGGLPYSTNYFSGAGGGDATIIYYETQELGSRIMVSGGGGGGTSSSCFLMPGYVGGVVAGNGGSNRINLISIGGSQDNGTQNGVGQNGRNGQLGDCGKEGNPGCGGGYRGGMTTTVTGDYSDVSGSGGSSYISGDPYCKTNPLATFHDTKILAGNKYFNLPDGTQSLGNPSHGYLRITKLAPIPTCHIMCYFTKHSFFFIFIFIIET
ncbi:hypothetical protein TVAG_053020 [Trichomonas vaginalis G3]|uniref:receptor protein-tyrosine kinase n=1 Tax=Trichomonas vaginalis (strain ATCC PRA-98 / G3) TaxID=412133 RepID=A2F6L4_TRIV3|nr:glycine-rich protein family [Trichomonas vaginalis G3]EAX99459.1 hypothetical protein TVAG_053020 [Trichomonas vaginalis G3]KAI5541626.1 glycine-rich protein family [Trichomonas vaginalis G3]|eukprot:XP_001312389.1 hypothetical protein [Trichomonas vaginalis G3]